MKILKDSNFLCWSKLHNQCVEACNDIVNNKTILFLRLSVIEIFLSNALPIDQDSMFQSSSMVANGSPNGTENGQLDTVGSSASTLSSSASTLSSSESIKAAYAYLPQTPIRSTDAHLVEFSEAMRSTSSLFTLITSFCYFSFIYLVLRETSSNNAD
jgi:hypothetical protein